jgi:hypothetical protein
MATAFLGARCGLANTSMHFTQFLASFFWSGIDVPVMVLGRAFAGVMIYSMGLLLIIQSLLPDATTLRAGPGNILQPFC